MDFDFSCYMLLKGQLHINDDPQILLFEDIFEFVAIQRVAMCMHNVFHFAEDQYMALVCVEPE